MEGSASGGGDEFVQGRLLAASGSFGLSLRFFTLSRFCLSHRIFELKHLLK